MIQTVSLTRNPNLSAPKVDRSNPNEVLKKFGSSWWTGQAPEFCKGYDPASRTLFALPLINLNIATRQDVLDYFDNTWTLTEVLFSALKNEETYTRPPYHQLRHPMIFYYGHTAVLFLNKLRLAGVIKEPVDLYLEKVLETGVDEMSWDDMSKNEMLWPSLEIVHAYKKKIYSILKNLISTHPDLEDISKIRGDNPLWALFMGFEHEKIHFETSSVLIRELPLELVETPRYWPSIHPSGHKKSDLKPQTINRVEWVQSQGGTVTWGKPESAPSYGWDNEYGKRQKTISPFQVSRNLITNGEFFEFVSSLAYTDDKYWSEEGLLWRKFRNTKRPTFWVGYGPEGSHEYKLRTIFEIIDMPWDWPAEVNYHEAKAYCHWLQEKDKTNLKYRLITEPEHVSLRGNDEDLVLQQTTFSNSQEGLRKFPYNYNFNFSSASPVGSFGASNDKVSDLFGNVWQWAEDQFNPLEGFKINPLYDDFSTPCFDGKHQMILGGSFISCGHEASKWARFHFRPHFFQHSGFRIAATLDGTDDNGSTKLKKSTSYVHPQRANTLNQMQNTDWWKSVFQPLETSSDEIRKAWEITAPVMTELESQFSLRSPIGSALDVETNKVKEGFIPPYQANKNFPSGPQELDKLLNLIKSDLMPLGQGVGHSGYMAYVAGAGNPIANIAQAVSQAINQFTGHYSLSPGLVTLEQEALSWIINMAGYDEHSLGVFTSGGSQANLQALSLARKAKLKGYDLAKARYYCSAQVHHCIGKALSILGFPAQSLHLINCDANQKMDITLLEEAIRTDIKNGYQPIAVIGTAGTTNTGAVDDLEAIAEICNRHQLWFHIDAAYGGFFLLTDHGKEKLSGFSRSDSAALDLHKALSTPYGTGCLIVKDAAQMNFEYAGASSYMPPSSTDSDFSHEVDFADISMELSRDARGLRIWLPIKYYGVEPFQLNLEEKLKLTNWLYEKIKKNDLVEFACNPDLSILTFRLKNSKTKELLNQINRDGRYFLTGCTIQDHFYIRICLLGFRTHFEHVEELAKLIDKTLKALK